MMNYKSRKGFTLAEVLITLGIIGVVAALTIPTLISAYKKNIVESRLRKCYGRVNQAIKLSEIENGPIMTWEKLNSGFETDENGELDHSKPYAVAWYNKYLAPYIKSVKMEIPNNTATGYINIYLPDGSLMIFCLSSVIFYPNANDYQTITSSSDPNIVHNNPENSGTKYFTFYMNPWSTSTMNSYHYGKMMEPYMYNWDGTRDGLFNDSLTGCSLQNTKERAFCTKLIQMNNWKIPDDYPLKF